MFFYNVISTILFLTVLPIYYLIRLCRGKFLYGWDIKLGFFKNPDLGDKVIMFHGVSVGEIIALENLIKKTKEVFPQYQIVVTTGTKTGQDIAKKKYAAIADLITYFPFDVSPCVFNFLKKIHPQVVLMAETEIWPTFAVYCRRFNIKLYTINGRISDSTFSLYKAVKNFFKHVFSFYTEILTQSVEDAEKFITLGALQDKVKVMKNLKFDVKKSDEKISIENNGAKIIIAGSTHKGENEIVINTFSELKKEGLNIKLLIAPRHTKRVPEIKFFAQNAGLKFGLRSANDNFLDNDIVILDTMGELGKMYAICDVAFIGGSFNKTGGHNPLEATIYSKPVISGPDVHNFKDIYHIIGKTDAGKIVSNQNQFKEYLRKLICDEKFYSKACKDCESVFEDQKGALDIVISTLKDVLS